MEKKYEIDMLTKFSVSIKTQAYATIEGKSYDLGLPHRKAYTNNAGGREELAAELPEPYLTSVLAVWDDETTSEA